MHLHFNQQYNENIRKIKELIIFRNFDRHSKSFLLIT